MANFVRIRACEQIDTAVNAASHLYYALYRRGFAAVRWEKGDFLTLLDAFALRSQRHAKAARDSGRLTKEIMPVQIPATRKTAAHR